jgi:type II secretory pathway pseudopilin PulG
MNQSAIPSRTQGGAALITALVMMTIMTLLAITSMGTNTLEEKMASNAQEVNRAFQTAETGLAKVLDRNDAFDTANQVDDMGTPFDLSDDVYDFTDSDTDVGDEYHAETVYQAEFRQKTVPKRSAKGWNRAIYSFYHFDLSATGTTFSGVSTTLHAGAYQVGPK